MVEEKQFEEVKYLISYPEDFQADKKYALVIFLHGAGTRSKETKILSNNSNFLNICKRQSRGYIVIAPLCSVNNWNEVMPTLIRLVEAARELEYVDSKHVHLTGNSMGGYGTWELASLRPDWFASIMPVCGGGIAWMAANLVDIPIRTFHGLQDTVVDPIESLQMAKAVNRKGGHAEMILFPDCAHNCWDAVYSNDVNYDWLLAFSTERDRTLVEQLTGDYYG